MNVLEAIKSRTSIRAFSDKQIDPEDFAKILEAARWSPSPIDAQPWHFIIVRSREMMEKLAETADHGKFIKLAPIMVVGLSKEEEGADAWLAEHDQYTYSTAIAMYNMWLTAWDMGIGSCWVTLDDETTRKLLNIPENYKMLGCMIFGYPRITPIPHIEKDRKPITEFISHEKF